MITSSQKVIFCSLGTIAVLLGAPGIPQNSIWAQPAPKSPATQASPAPTPAVQRSAAKVHRAEVEIRLASRESLGKGLTKATLTSGLTMLVRENHAAPVATVRCFVRNTGSAYEGRFLGTGISHMLEHLVAGGTTANRPEEETQKLMDKMGGQNNAFTSTDITAFLIDCPSEHVNTAIELIADNMQHSLIPETEYRREMEVVQRELEMGEASRDRVLHHAMKGLIYQEHPMRHPTIGYLPVVQQVTREDVISFYRSRYVAQNMVFVVVGDVQTDQILEQVTTRFKTFQRTTERGAVLPEEPQQASARFTRLEMEGDTTHMSIGWPTVALQHPDMYALDVVSYLLAHGESSRIALRLTVESPLAISVDSSSYTPGFVPGWFDISFQCPPDNLEACSKIIDEELDRLRKELVTEAELAKVKRQKSAEHVFAQQTVQQQADAMAMSYVSTGDPLFDDQYVEGIQAVTAEQIRDVVRRYLRNERLNTVIIDPIGRKRSAVQEEVAAVESDVTKYQLPNGLTVLLKRHAVTPTVNIQVFTNGGVLSDSPEKSGLAALTAELMTRGTEKYTGRQIAEYFDSVGGALNVTSQRSTSAVQCNVLTEDWATALDYVYQVVFRPKFEEAEFVKIREQQLARIAARRADPQTEIMDFWTQQLPKTLPYSRTILGSEPTVARLSVKDCQELHQTCFTPGNMVVSVFGDIDPDDAFKKVEQLFGKIPAGQKPAFKYAATHDGHTASNAHLTSQKQNTAMLVISYPTVNVKEEKTRAAIDVINTVLTGSGGAGGRLFNELRGEGLVYYVFGMELTGPAPGYFLFMAQTRPESTNDVTERIQAGVNRIAKEGVPKEEFELAKEKLLAAFAMRNTTPSSQAFQACIDELYGFGYDHHKQYYDRIRAVTSDEVKGVAERLLQKPIIVTSGPASQAPKGKEKAK